MNLEELRKDLILKQKKGLPFIMTSVAIWFLITIVASLNLPIKLTNLLALGCSALLLPISWVIGKKMGVDIFEKNNELGNLAFIFTINQVLYLLIVMWVFAYAPEKMIMVYAMVFGAHLLPYSWVYKSRAYCIFAVVIPVVSLIVGTMLSAVAVAAVGTVVELVFSLVLRHEVKGI